MNRKTHTITLKDRSPAELAKFRQQMHTLWQTPGGNLNNLIHTPLKKETSTKKTAKPSTKKTNQPNIKNLNVRGFIIAENGIRLHATPTPHDAIYASKKGIAATIYKPSAKSITVLYEDLQNKGWYKIRTNDKKEGFIEKQHITILKVNNQLDSFTHTYHFVKAGENFENHIAKKYLNHIPLRTGFDRRTLAQAFFLLNSQSGHDHGITMDNKNISASDYLELAYKAQYDPSFNKARLDYKALQLKQGHVVRVPNYKYIQLQSRLGTLSQRPEFMNDAIGAGRVAKEIIEGMAGLIAGIVEGLVLGIYDMLVGIIDSIQQIIETIYDLFTGVLFDKLKTMFNNIVDTIKSMTAEDIKKAFVGLLGKAGEHIMKIINNWKKASSFEKGKVIGLVLGTLLLEILLAIFTGGSANMAKWASKLGKLGKVIIKVADFAHDIKAKLKAKLPKKYFEKGVYANDKDDTKNWQRALLYAEGLLVTKKMDDNGNTITQLENRLTAIKLFPKLKRKWGSHSRGGNVHAVTLTASPTKEVYHHFTSGEKGNWNKKLNGKLNPNETYDVGGYLYKTDDLGRVNKVKAKLELKNKGRNKHQQGKSVTLKDGVKGQDDGGHLIAQIFNGPGEQINYVPQKSSLNRGAWKTMENQWAKALKEKKKVNIEINNIFEGNSKRPKFQKVIYKIEDEVFEEIFKN